MKSILLTLTMAVALVWSASAQSLEATKSKLATNSSSGASVKVVEHGEAATAIKTAVGRSTRSKVRVYKVVIFYDNSQDARGSWAAAGSRFETLFPGVSISKTYENPYFKIVVGNCLTQEEAVVLWSRVKAHFPKAFLSREEVNISVFGE